MDKLADLKESGMGMDELATFALENRLNVHHWFFSTDLHYYVLGGRISKAAGAIGGALKICPVLNMSNEGKLTPREKVRTKKTAIARVVNIMKEHATDGKEYRGKVFICNSACLEDAQAVASMVEEAFSNKLRTSCSSPFNHKTSSRSRSMFFSIVVLPTWRAPKRIRALP